MTESSGPPSFPPPTAPLPPPSVYGAYAQQPWQPFAVPPRVPGTVQAAVIITYVCCALTVLMTIFFLLVAAWVGSYILDSFTPSDQASLVVVALISAAVTIGACALASWLAWQTWRRRQWARIGLTVCSSVALVGSVLTFGPPTLFVAPAAIAVVVLLFVQPSNDWFDVAD